MPSRDKELQESIAYWEERLAGATNPKDKEYYLERLSARRAELAQLLSLPSAERAKVEEHFKQMRREEAEEEAYAAAEEKAETGSQEEGGTVMTDRCPCDCKNLPEFSLEDVIEAGIFLGYLDDSRIDGDIAETEPVPGKGSQVRPTVASVGSSLEGLQAGMAHEMEHCDLTHGDPFMTARIAIAHIKEDTEYYAKLKKAGL